MATPIPGPVEIAAVNAMAGEILDAVYEDELGQARDLLQLLTRRFSAPGLLMAMSEWVRIAEDHAGTDMVLMSAETLLRDLEKNPDNSHGDVLIEWATQWVRARILDDTDTMLELIADVQNDDPGPWIWVLVNICRILMTGPVVPS